MVYYCNKNEFVKETLYNGWLPIIIAMLISRQVIELFKKNILSKNKIIFLSSSAGVILGKSIELYSIIALYQPVINGNIKHDFRF